MAPEPGEGMRRAASLMPLRASGSRTTGRCRLPARGPTGGRSGGAADAGVPDRPPFGDGMLDARAGGGHAPCSELDARPGVGLAHHGALPASGSVWRRMACLGGRTDGVRDAPSGVVVRSCRASPIENVPRFDCIRARCGRPGAPALDRTPIPGRVRWPSFRGVRADGRVSGVRRARERRVPARAATVLPVLAPSFGRLGSAIGPSEVGFLRCVPVPKEVGCSKLAVPSPPLAPRGAAASGGPDSVGRAPLPARPPGQRGGPARGRRPSPRMRKARAGRAPPGAHVPRFQSQRRPRRWLRASDVRRRLGPGRAAPARPRGMLPG
ncbi:uncharacterized protein LOC127263288 [Andrographis paniculata]|uniref:uncharacterized protein LOC127251307 n=1 Tax=Andrographis paniculata TaxID=175694 RepID=UPI0021E87E86|nr:uncharacterized protein LOC127251307 [Andrographis paniculata]XP_051148241.1 uncharacterized protein LOC127263287 [Andrographis paniculata]XP_051148242.1 uncharacterized protein LOC127263288 [Andrographis paniculata]